MCVCVCVGVITWARECVGRAVSNTALSMCVGGKEECQRRVDTVHLYVTFFN